MHLVPFVFPTTPFDAHAHGNPSEFVSETYPTKTREMGLLYAENCTILVVSNTVYYTQLPALLTS